uniref:Uncharacterized protein n=1 Tax=Rhizophora mucronata TaxID=61149 RepID=A0A2P2R2U1_RHIMU
MARPQGFLATKHFRLWAPMVTQLVMTRVMKKMI